MSDWVYDRGNRDRGAERRADGQRMWERDCAGDKPFSEVCGFVNGIPGDWSRDRLLRTLMSFGNVVAAHFRMSTDYPGNYDGAGFVQYRDPEELSRAMRECNARRFCGKGKDKGNGYKWTKEIRLRIDQSHREFDIVNLEEDRRKDWELQSRGKPGIISACAPRVCTSENDGDWERVMFSTDNEWWGVSPWEIAGKPDREGNLREDVMDYPR